MVLHYIDKFDGYTREKTILVGKILLTKIILIFYFEITGKSQCVCLFFFSTIYETKII